MVGGGTRPCLMVGSGFETGLFGTVGFFIWRHGLIPPLSSLVAADESGFYRNSEDPHQLSLCNV